MVSEKPGLAPLRAIFWEYRESKDTYQKLDFFILFFQNIPLGKLIQEKNNPKFQRVI